MLRAPQNEENFSRLCFDQEVWLSKGKHIPEYSGMNIRQQYKWAKVGVERFYNIFGYYPKCGVNSDCITGTEEVWSLLGIEVRPLKCWLDNKGERHTYTNKPNTLDINNIMGTYNKFLDLVYLNRNVFLEALLFGRDWADVEHAYKAVLRAWDNNEPAIISTHRGNYVSLFPEKSKEGRVKLKELLSLLSPHKPVYLSSYEVAQRYKKGNSL